MRPRRLLTGVALVGSLAAAVLLRRRAQTPRTGRRLFRGRLDDLAGRRLDDPAARAADPRDRALTDAELSPQSASTPTWRATSSSARASAPSTTSTSTASRPCLSCSRRSASGSRLWRRTSTLTQTASRPRARRRHAGRRSVHRSRKPFLIVRGEAKNYGTANQLEGAFSPGERVFWSRTWSQRPVRRPMPSEPFAKLASNVATAICVIDREEGGVDSLARLGVRLHPLFRAAEVVGAKTAEKGRG